MKSLRNVKRIRLREELKMEKQHIFIIGSKGIPAQYGGYETFVDKLTQYKKDENIQYHVACAVDNIDDVSETFEYNGAQCFNIAWKKIGPARAIAYDIDAIKWSLRYIKKNNIEKPIFYILACRIGPFIKYYKEKIEKLGGKLYVNPDGHEWKRAKWSLPVRKYWKLSEQFMVKHSDMMICDSKNIEKYIKEEYKKYNPKTTFISYGSEITKSILSDNDKKLIEWYKEKGLKSNNYYLVVGRFVPENNYEIMIKEFMKSNTSKDFALITNVSEKFLNELKLKTGFDKDSRIKFVGTVYDQELLKKIRENAYAYFHGHEVGGTNPSLLEALSYTKLNLLLDIGFNREVAEEGAMYWKKEPGNLSNLIDKVEKISIEEVDKISLLAQNRIKECYSWDYIVSEYEKFWNNVSWEGN